MDILEKKNRFHPLHLGRFLQCQMSNVKNRDEKWKRGDTRSIGEHFTFVQKPDKLVSLLVIATHIDVG